MIINTVLLTNDVKQCGIKKNLQHGKFLHAVAVRFGCDDHLYIANTLVWMYSRCNKLWLAHDIFDKMISQDVVSWTTLILGYMEHGDCITALDIFKSVDCAPDRIAFLAAVRACLALAKKTDKQSSLMTALSLHKQAINLGFDKDLVIATTFVDVYSKCGDMLKARDVFDKMEKRSVVSWNILILGYVDNNESRLALEVFNKMDCVPDRVTFLVSLKACAISASEKIINKEKCLQNGVSIHMRAKELGFDKYVNVANTLVNMYSKCGDMDLARQVFDGIIKRNVVSWNVLTFGYLENGDKSLALEIFSNMDCDPNCVSFVGALKACAGLAADANKQTFLRRGVTIHMQIKALGFDKDVGLMNTLIYMYCKCGDMTRACDVFTRMVRRSSVSWNVLILGYVENRQSSLALDVFMCMDCPPNRVTIVAALKACGSIATETELNKTLCLQQGVIVHNRARGFGLHKDLVVANALIDMYCKCGDMHRAHEIFDEITVPSVVSWSTLILGYVENEQNLVALDLFNRMDCAADSVAFVAALKACGNLGALEKGRTIHNHISELGLEDDEIVATSLVDFYGKCGNMVAAEDVFSRRQSKNTAVWNAFIGGYVLLGNWIMVFHVVERMREIDVPLNSVTLLLVLTACNHAGLVNEAYKYLRLMPLYNINPTVEHYGCLIDMLGRANRLEEALALAKSMPCAANAVIWTSLLGACTKWNNERVGAVAFHALVALESEY